MLGGRDNARKKAMIPSSPGVVTVEKIAAEDALKTIEALAKIDLTATVATFISLTEEQVKKVEGTIKVARVTNKEVARVIVKKTAIIKIDLVTLRTKEVTPRQVDTDIT